MSSRCTEASVHAVRVREIWHGRRNKMINRPNTTSIICPLVPCVVGEACQLEIRLGGVKEFGKTSIHPSLSNA